jgi:hypothetical protein
MAHKFAPSCFFLTDIQGYPREKAEYSKSFLVHLKVELQIIIAKHYYPRFDGAFVTSQQLISYFKKEFLRRTKRDFKFYLVRCGTLVLPDYSQIATNRAVF